MDMLKISEKIKAKRRERDLTQEELAAMLGVTKAAVSKWETAESYPDITMLPQIAQLFHLSMDELFGYTLEYKPLKIINKYSVGFALDDIEDQSLFDHGTIEECKLEKRGHAIGEMIEDTWEVRVHMTSTEHDFPYTMQKCMKPDRLIDMYSVRLADGKMIDDDQPNKHYVCKKKVWEYRNTDLKYLKRMLNEQAEMGLIEETDLL